MPDTRVNTDVPDAGIRLERSGTGMLTFHIYGAWDIKRSTPDADGYVSELKPSDQTRLVQIESENLTTWDSSLLTFLLKIREHCSRNGIDIRADNLPEGVRRLLALALAVPERKGARRKPEKISFTARVGEAAIRFGKTHTDMLNFIGEISIAFTGIFTGRARFKGTDLLRTIQECGAQSLPIVSLISGLVGLILAFVGAIQLRMFGAQIYVADLVGIGMVREMGAIMTGIIMAGRTGAAFAARIGTMQVNEEIDAFKALGISPIEFLVLPRLIALALMMPLLCLYADLLGILGGMIVGVGMLDINSVEYYHHTRDAVSLNDFWIGIFMSFVFGILVALSGCLRGMQCGRSASAVGDAATSAVVTGIVSIIVATAVITVLCDVMGI